MSTTSENSTSPSTTGEEMPASSRDLDRSHEEHRQETGSQESRSEESEAAAADAGRLEESDAVPEHRTRVVRTPGSYAVLLNGRAKGWTGSVHESVQRFVPNRDLFLTDDFRQAERTVEKLLQEDYDAIFTGGGDGTVVYLINAIEERIRDGVIDRADAPPIGVLRLGTGNAIAHYLGAGDIIDDLRALRAGAALRLHDVQMIESAEGVFPFAGFGWDAEILNDYDVVKETSRETFLENYATGLGGYFAAITTRTIPRVLRQRAARLVATNRGEVAHAISQDGEILESFGPGEVFFEGEAQIAGISSIPFWGFEIRMFPHADSRPGFAEFRTFNGTPYDVLRHLRSWWQGTIKRGEVNDFLVREMELEIDGEPLAYQVTGDAAGYERDVVWSVCDHTFPLAVPVR